MFGDDGKLLAPAPDLLYPTCSGWGFLHSSTSSTIIVSYIKLALQVLRSIFFTKLAFLGVLLSVFIIVFFWYRWHRWRQTSIDARRWKLDEFLRPLDFTAEDIVDQANRENDLIGMGGFGNVYRVRLPWTDPKEFFRRPVAPSWRLSLLDFGRFGSRRRRPCSDSGRRAASSEATGTGHRRTVVVKELRRSKEQDKNKNLDKQFGAEAKALGSIRHRNIVTLLCCITSICTSLLVYEDMQNGSLDQWLRKPRGRLDWPSRVGIATDAARGLSYMHDQAIIHRDVKSSNILLDHNFGAKIGDFGLARVLAKPGESEPASAVWGTPGHIAPEYLRNAEVSEKMDVYSFGVVLLELITGKKPHNAGTEPGIGLARWASQQYRRNRVVWEHIIDKDIQNPAYEEDMKAVFKLALSCTSEDPLDRPAMNEVLQELCRYDRSRVIKRRGKKRTTESFGAKIYRNIRDKIFTRG